MEPKQIKFKDIRVGDIVKWDTDGHSCTVVELKEKGFTDQYKTLWGQGDLWRLIDRPDASTPAIDRSNDSTSPIDLAGDLTPPYVAAEEETNRQVELTIKELDELPENDYPTETIEPPKVKAHRVETILEEAQRLCTSDRAKEYGPYEKCYGPMLEMFKSYTGHNFTLEDFTILMVLVKLNRNRTKKTRENLVDACGYLFLLSEAVEDYKE